MKKKLKDYDDVLYCCHKDYAKYNRAKTRKYSGNKLSFRKNLTGCWDDPGSTRSGWTFFWKWFDSRVGKSAVTVRAEFATCKKWNNRYFINQKWDRFVNDRWVIAGMDRESYYIDNDGILQKYD